MDLPTRGRTRVSLTGDSELDHFWGGRDFMLQPVQVSCSRKEGDQVTSSGHGVAGLLLHDLCPCNCSMLDQIDTDLNWSQRNAEANHFPDLFSCDDIKVSAPLLHTRFTSSPHARSSHHLFLPIKLDPNPNPEPRTRSLNPIPQPVPSILNPITHPDNRTLKLHPQPSTPNSHARLLAPKHTHHADALRITNSLVQGAANAGINCFWYVFWPHLCIGGVIGIHAPRILTFTYNLAQNETFSARLQAYSNYSTHTFLLTR
ncbi:hypothetical protein AAMO2058_000631500 [Amorphochlora amoebiformis]